MGDAVAAGRPAAVSLPRPLELLLLDAFGSSAGVTLMDGEAWRGGPQSALRAASDALAHSGAGAHDPPMDHLIEGRAVWALCPDDRRAALGALAPARGPDGDGLDDIVRSSGAVVTDAILRGRPPVRVRARATLDRIVVAVRDAGPGPADPFAGLLPQASVTDEAGRGPAIACGSCDRVALTRDDDGFTVRLVVRTALGRSLVGET